MIKLAYTAVKFTVKNYFTEKQFPVWGSDLDLFKKVEPHFKIEPSYEKKWVYVHEPMDDSKIWAQFFALSISAILNSS